MSTSATRRVPGTEVDDLVEDVSRRARWPPRVNGCSASVAPAASSCRSAYGPGVVAGRSVVRVRRCR
ncbi:hypothetical protein V2I01_32190 [Micromonospora sp. BRA006-A]|nr:hypothetical protein [Micromonospora sp. BRA006-A]